MCGRTRGLKGRRRGQGLDVVRPEEIEEDRAMVADSSEKSLVAFLQQLQMDSPRSSQHQGPDGQRERGPSSWALNIRCKTKSTSKNQSFRKPTYLTTRSVGRMEIAKSDLCSYHESRSESHRCRYRPCLKHMFNRLFYRSRN